MPPNYLCLNVVGLWKFPFVPLSLTGHVPVREHFCVFVDMLGFFLSVCVWVRSFFVSAFLFKKKKQNAIFVRVPLRVCLCICKTWLYVRVNLCVHMQWSKIRAQQLCALLAACCSAGLCGSMERLAGVSLCSAVERLTLPQRPPTLPAAWLCCHGDQIWAVSGSL